MMDYAYIAKKKVLIDKYGSFASQFAGYEDERLIFMNEYNVILDVCQRMAELNVNNIFICGAVNKHIRVYEETMQEIIKKFTGYVWCGDTYRWQKV